MLELSDACQTANRWANRWHGWTGRFDCAGNAVLTCFFSTCSL